MKILLTPTPAESAAGKPETAAEKIARLEKENAALRQQAETFAAAQACAREKEAAVAKLTSLGLTRQQAINKIERQEQFNKAFPHRTPDAVAKKAKG